MKEKSGKYKSGDYTGNGSMLSHSSKKFPTYQHENMKCLCQEKKKQYLRGGDTYITYENKLSIHSICMYVYIVIIVYDFHKAT
jgi:hypothetical protein